MTTLYKDLSQFLESINVSINVDSKSIMDLPNLQKNLDHIVQRWETITEDQWNTMYEMERIEILEKTANTRLAIGNRISYINNSVIELTELFSKLLSKYEE